MKTNLRILSCTLLLSTSLSPVAADVSNSSWLNTSTTPRLVVKYKAIAAVNGQAFPLSTVQAESREKDIVKRANMPLVAVKTMAGGALVYDLGKELSIVEAKAVAERIAADPRVEYAQPDVRVKPSQALTKDKNSYLQWPLWDRPAAPGGANFGPAWALSKGSSVIIGVIDTGILPHTDLVGQVTGGYDFIQTPSVSGDGDGRDNDPTDNGDFCEKEANPASTWHGLNVAGILVALADNNFGVAGAAHKAKVMPLRALGRCGGYMSDVSDAMAWSVGVSVPGLPDNPTPVHVLNLSLGGAPGTICYDYMQTAINAAISRKVPVVVAAGNESSLALGAPANCSGVIVVGAHTRSADMAKYSNRAAAVDLTGPGGGACELQTATCNSSSTVSITNSGKTLVSTESEGSYFIGTSAAAPHVSAAIALIRAVNMELSPAEVLAILKATAAPHAADSYCAKNKGMCGAGMLDAFAAANAAQAPVASITHSYKEATIAGSKVVTLQAGVSNSLGSSYQWKQLSGTPVDLVGANTATAKFTTPATRTNLVFELVVATALNTTISAKETVAVNNAPIITSTEFTSLVGAVAVFNVIATDVDGDSLTYTLVSATYPGTKLEGSKVYWPVGGGTGKFVIEVSDAYGLVVSATVPVYISNPPAAGGSTTTTDSGGKGGGAISMGQLAGFCLLIAGLFLGKKEEEESESNKT
jgi:serine protease